MTQDNAYKDAGVDIDAGEELVTRIKPLVKATDRSGVMSGLGGFGALFDVRAAGYDDPVLVSSTDGVGTKLKIAIDTGYYHTVGIDLVAMCVNDLIVQGAEPLFFLDYFATGKLDVDQAADVIGGIAKGCELSGCALIGGETAEMPGMYGAGDFDLAGFTVGAVERGALVTGEAVQEGDVVLGLASNGLHSNGFSLIRKLVATTQGVSYDSPVPFSSDKTTLGEELLTPTRLYVKPVLAILKAFPGTVHGMAHITGGGLLENIPRSIPDGLCARIDAMAWPFPPLYQWLKKIGALSNRDLSRTLNTGIGFVMIVSAEHAGVIANHLSDAGETVFRLGEILPATPGAPRINLENTETGWAV
ncbi:MAG: phosphoribosylformylglycinamidine cyclo-ligase [Rhodospirillales bacterium]|nr:phosphoribosylformylglycinamidine cyclo-ligase [Rhodospirillales bacterium]